jgi:hypothetical protein
MLAHRHSLFSPGSTAILSTIATVEGNTCKNNLRPFRLPVKHSTVRPRKNSPMVAVDPLRFCITVNPSLNAMKAQLFVHKMFLKLRWLFPVCAYRYFDAQFFLPLPKSSDRRSD